jgi:hypothetical protein
MMVMTTVTAFGKTLDMLLPVMDHNNKAIKDPDSFAINKAYMRCLAKNVAAHGIGLYIFAGEDIPNAEDTPSNTNTPPPATSSSTSKPAASGCISEAQGKRLFAICKSSGTTIADCANKFGFKKAGEIRKDQYKEICEWAEVGHKAEMVQDVMHGDTPPNPDDIPF